MNKALTRRIKYLSIPAIIVISVIMLWKHTCINPQRLRTDTEPLVRRFPAYKNMKRCVWTSGTIRISNLPVNVSSSETYTFYIHALTWFDKADSERIVNTKEWRKANKPPLFIEDTKWKKANKGNLFNERLKQYIEQYDDWQEEIDPWKGFDQRYRPTVYYSPKGSVFFLDIWFNSEMR